MSLILQGSTSGSITLQEPAVAGTTVLNLPATSGTVLVGGTQNIPKAALPTGSVLQVVQTVKTDVFTTSSTSFVDVTGLSASITPTNATSKVLVIVSGYASPSGSNYAILGKLVRASTDIALGDARGSSTSASFGVSQSATQNSSFFGINFLDSPATTSSTTYKVQAAVESGGTLLFGGSYNSNASYNTSTPITLTLMEIAA